VTLIDPKTDDLKYEMQEEARPTAKIKVVGVGGGGSNAVAHMMNAGLDGAEFYVLNTDVQALRASPVPNKLPIGCKITRGRGAGADPEVGRQAALEDTERIVEILQGADIVFVTAGLGSGTGTGAAPVVAAMAKQMDALTIAVVTTPFAFEGLRRFRQAEEGLKKLAQNVDTVITIPNERLLELAPRGTSVMEAFRMGHEFLRQVVEDITEIVTTPGFINRDFSDVRSALLGMGHAVLGTATARGEKAALEAARQAISCPLLEGDGIRGARHLLLNFTGSSRLGLHEVGDACRMIREATGSEDVQLSFGLVLKESLGEAVKVTVIAAGFPPREEAPEYALEAAAPASRPLWLAEAGPEEAPAPEPVIEAAPAGAVEAKPPNGTPPLPESEFADELDMPAILRQNRPY
jgi:cell division protein FtsZ